MCKGLVCLLTGNFDTERPLRVERSAKKCVHTPHPEAYLEWHEWAAKASKTHSQVRCPHCGTWSIWLPKKEASAIRKTDAAEARKFVKAYNAMWDARKAST